MVKKIIMLTGTGSSSTFIYNGLKDHFTISKVIVENKPNRNKFLKNRIKKLGYIQVIGQIIFQFSIPKILSYIYRKRISELKTNLKLNDTPVPEHKLIKVESVNDLECINLLKKIKPDLVIVNGTRIISKKVLTAIETIFINTHVGITPKYRGVHGGYWAMTNQDKDNCGVTVHFVNSGIDTGGIIYQQNITPTSKDSFATYPLLQTGLGIDLMKKTIKDFQQGIIKESKPRSLESQLWYHPTIWFYLWKWISKGVK